MSDKKLKAINEGTLTIGDKKLAVAVLGDGKRIITQNALFLAFGRPARGSRKKGDQNTPKLPGLIDANNLKQFISNELTDLIKPIKYEAKNGREVEGYDATILPHICEVYIEARDAKRPNGNPILTAKQTPNLVAAEIVLRALSRVGIIGLVDEATGYEKIKKRNDLQEILAAYIRKEFLPWTKKFPDEFYENIFKLKKWSYNPMSVKRPKVLGKITENIVYKRINPDVLIEIKKLNPKNESGNRSKRHHQFLTTDIGNPHFEKHIASLITLMRISANWSRFMGNVERAFPIQSSQLSIGFPDDDEEIDID